MIIEVISRNQPWLLLSADSFVNADGLCGDSLMVKRRSLAAQQPVLPGEAVMLGALAKKRSTPRMPVRRTAWITFNSSLKHEHIAMVKDISVKGVYFYSDFRPAVGDTLDFVVEFLTGSDKVRLHLKGTVLRVEQSAPGSASGTAVSFYAQCDEVLSVTAVVHKT
jgi:PilZ domain